MENNTLLEGYLCDALNIDVKSLVGWPMSLISQVPLARKESLVSMAL